MLASRVSKERKLVSGFGFDGEALLYEASWRDTTSRMRKKPDGHEYLGAGVEISGLSGELAVESGWRRRFTD